MRIASNTLLAGIAAIGLSGDVFALPIWSHHADKAPSAGDQATRSNVPLNLALDVDFGNRRDNSNMFTDTLLGFGEDPADVNYGWPSGASPSDPCADLGSKCTATGNDVGDIQDANGGLDSGYDYDVIGDVLNNPPNEFSGTGPNGLFGNGFAFNGPSGGNPPNSGPHFHGPSGPFNFISPGVNQPGKGNDQPPSLIDPPFFPPPIGPTGPIASGGGDNNHHDNQHKDSKDNPPDDKTTDNNSSIINLADNGPAFGDNPPGDNPPNNDPPGDNPPNNDPPPLGLAPLNTPLLLDVNLPDPPADPVPAPAGIALFGIGLASTAFLRRRKDSPHK